MCRYEQFSAVQVVPKLKTGPCMWLHHGSVYGHVSATEHQTRSRLLSKWVHWYVSLSTDGST